MSQSSIKKISEKKKVNECLNTVKKAIYSTERLSKCRFDESLIDEPYESNNSNN